MRTTLFSLKCLAALCLLARPATAQTPSSATFVQGVGLVIRASATTHDAGSGSGMAQVFDTKADVTFTEDGVLRRGPAAVRAYLDSLAEPARLYGSRMAVKIIDVEQLGAEYALGP